MARPNITAAAPRYLLIVASVVVVLAGLRAASDIIVPVLVALLVSLLSFPVLFWLLSKRVPSGLAVAVTILVDLALLAGAVSVVTGSINEMAREAPKYRARFGDYQEQLQRSAESTADWLSQRGVVAPSWLSRIADNDPAQPATQGDSTGDPESEAIEGAAEVPDSVETGSTADPALAAQTWWLNLFDLNAVFGLANRTLRGVAATVSNILIVVLITAFILLEAVTFRRKIRLAFGRGDPERRVQRILDDLRHYLGIKTAVSAVTGLLIGIWLAILGIDFAMLWGLAAFLLNFIPNLGSIIAAIPTVLLATVQQGFGAALLVAIGYLAVNLVIGNLVEPQLMGRRLGLSTLVVFLSLVFWGWMWGPIGMLLSVPLTMMVKILLENTEDFQWAAVLLGNVDPRAGQRLARSAKKAVPNRKVVPKEPVEPATTLEK